MNYIAPQMMVVRALVAGLDLHLTDPIGERLLHDQTSYRIISMVPLQVFNTLQGPTGKQKLEQTAILLIGGGRWIYRLRKQAKRVE
jgi:O-succinylbenzoic acid--CoA ligase